MPENIDLTGQINALHDAQRQAQLDRLGSAYDRARAAYEANAEKIPEVYQAQGNDLAAQYERQRAAFNEQAAASGLNTGAGSQARLAQNSGYQKAYGQIAAAQADAQADAQRQLADLEAQYQAEITQALSDSDYNRAAALMQEYKDSYARSVERAKTLAELESQRGAALLSESKDAYQRDLARAKTLADYGDFSGYAALSGYGQDAAGNMETLWKMQNPDLAYNTGRMSAQEYFNATGMYPAGYSPAVSYGAAPVAPQGGNRGSVLDAVQKAVADGRTKTRAAGNRTGTAPSATGALSQEAVNSIAYNVGTARSKEEAMSYINNIPPEAFDMLTDAQIQALQNAVKHAGV